MDEVGFELGEGQGAAAEGCGEGVRDVVVPDGGDGGVGDEVGQEGGWGVEQVDDGVEMVGGAVAVVVELEGVRGGDGAGDIGDGRADAVWERFGGVESEICGDGGGEGAACAVGVWGGVEGGGEDLGCG